jgi:hypothetical protein
MSYRITEAAVRGDQRDSIPDILMAAGLEGYSGPEELESWDLISGEMFDAPSSKKPPVAACLVGDWTLLLNEKLALAILDFAEPLNSLVDSQPMTFFAVIADTSTGMYGYRLQGPSQARAVFVDGERLDESGEPLECEAPIIPEEYSEDDLLDIMAYLEVDFEEGLDHASPITVYRHSMSR